MSRSSLTSLLVLAAVLLADAALAQGTTFILDVLGVARPGPKEGGVVPWTFRVDAPAAGLVEVNIDIVLDVAIEPCASMPEVCVGENLITVVDPETGITFVTGCSDMMDNDLDGMTDAEDIECLGVGGFSFSVATDAYFNVSRATTRGTVSDLNTRPPGIRDPDGAFEKTEVIDPARNSGQQGPASTCPDAADCNDDGMTDLSDAIFTVEYQFRGGRAPPAPFPACGIDPTSGDLLARCARMRSCP